MLRQDPFENLISFICSSNNNISRITKMVKSLCQHYSPPLLTLPVPGFAPLSGTNSSGKEQSVPETYHPFPPPSVLAAPEVSAHLRLLGFGYRADFIQKTARMLVDAHGTARSADDPLEPPEKWLLTLRQMNTTSAREELLKFVGVGRKVADCIMLMSLDKKEVIPVDTHVHQIAVKHYGLRASSKTQSNMTPKLYEEVSSKLALVWGDYAGWAHSVLFTSDLKSFSSYGLSSPSPTPSVKPHRADKGIATPPDTPSPSLSKRKRSTLKHSAQRQSEDISISMPGESRPDESVEPEGLNLADRVKRRRRARESTC
ncbi:N-glycosylase/DNA lyase [Grifola frondosa]|uniref:DNA-(apurinic or apyrimidinic site) lyase n=1 Tax=Grifola frondosa TaxID=5627 RepID=A0A1C7LX90_GRIFR|nr:N-glycosylase/DNA lyase [Grifola frondosa]